MCCVSYLVDGKKHDQAEGGSREEFISGDGRGGESPKESAGAETAAATVAEREGAGQPVGSAGTL